MSIGPFNDLAEDSAGNIFFKVVTTGATADFGGGALAAGQILVSLDTNGSYRWGNSFGSTNVNWNSIAARGSLYCAAGTLKAATDFGGGLITPSGWDLLLVCFDQTGNYQWANNYATPSGIGSYGTTIDSSGNVTIAGGKAGNASMDFGGGVVTGPASDPIFVASYTSAGAYRWAHMYSASPSTYEQARRVTSNANDDIIFSGEMYGSVDFGGGPTNYVASSTVFVVMLDTNGNHLYSVGSGGVSQDYSEGIAAAGTTHAYVGGDLYSTLDFGPGPVTSTGNRGMFLGRLGL
ncbi:MAG: hypothetical protein IPJ88_02160 [Myxococcales bacterium]|nr:MAG: hypothetical protein IPJ88_02160 [Myxococcales bacterium]